MRRLARRAAALGLGLALGSAVSMGYVWASGRSLSVPTFGELRGLAQSSVESLAHLPLDLLAPKQCAAIEFELEGLGAHPWAGRYRTPGARCEELMIAPANGFTVYAHTGCGNCNGFEAMGQVRSSTDDRLLLEPDSAHTSFFGEAPGPMTVYLIDWGALRFAVPESRVESFCASVTDGTSMPRDFHRRTSGEAPAAAERAGEPRPPGRPHLPEALRALAPERPLEASIAALVDPAPRAEPGPGSKPVEALLRLDRGSDHGLVVGLRLVVEGVAGRGRVEAVERDSALLRLWTGREDEPVREALVGRTARTLHPEAADDR